jgi:hypothetical protein
MTAGTGIPELTFAREAKQKVFWTPPAERQSITEIRNRKVIIKCHKVKRKSNGDRYLSKDT